MSSVTKEQVRFDREHDSREDITRAEQQLAHSTGSTRDSDMYTLAYYLVRSPKKEERERGIALLDILLEETTTEQNDLAKSTVGIDYRFTLAYGLFLDDQLGRARKICQELLQLQPNSGQAKELWEMIEDKIRVDGLIGMGVVGGTAAAIGIGLIAGAIAIARIARK